MTTQHEYTASPTRDEFEAVKSRGFNQIPVIRRLPLGVLTPKAIFAAVGGRDRILLESTRVSPEDGRYSIVVTSSFQKLTAKGNSFSLNGVEAEGNPMQALREALARWKGYRPEGAPLFCGGAIGYFAYECNHYFEELPRHGGDDLGLPDLYILFTSRCIVVDHLREEILLIASGSDYDMNIAALIELEQTVARARPRVAACPERPHGSSATLAPFRANFARDAYVSAVRRVQEYIRAGDTYQVNLSQRLEIATDVDGFDLYERLSELSPVHFASYLDLDGFDIVGASPERLVRLEGGKLLTRPIAGTRRRGTEEEDARFITELTTDVKERAEHAMLVDLSRNDLGRVSEYGSVTVSKLMEIVKYAHVIHIESEVDGKLCGDKDFVDVIGAVFPGGTITGMPKVRTMEVITELEPNVRSIYTGSIGYINFQGDMDLNIVIRTVLLKDQKAYLNVGGGVVCDSIPEREYKETLNKARSALEALGSYTQEGSPCS